MGKVGSTLFHISFSHPGNKVVLAMVELTTFLLLLLYLRLKQSGEQVDDRIVEVHWDPSMSRWRMMRFRDDKPHGNHRTVVENIIQSIADGVEKEAVGLLPVVLLQ